MTRPFHREVAKSVNATSGYLIGNIDLGCCVYFQISILDQNTISLTCQNTQNEFYEKSNNFAHCVSVKRSLLHFFHVFILAVPHRVSYELPLLYLSFLTVVYRSRCALPNESHERNPKWSCRLDVQGGPGKNAHQSLFIKIQAKTLRHLSYQTKTKKRHIDISILAKYKPINRVEMSIRDFFLSTKVSTVQFL